ncbi:MAG: hypothetical protein BWZ09_00973 [Alphaproteobacteria bacterium ADurb.BinA305]|nr:MAG: hypothetical protein BWZ09_00973 [Alphaproteobacteria bacterium ADurb.BinA305]
MTGDAAEAEGLGKLGEIDVARLDLARQVRSDAEGFEHAQSARLHPPAKDGHRERAVEHELARTQVQARQRGRHHPRHARQTERLGEQGHRHRLEDRASAPLPACDGPAEDEIPEHQRTVEQGDARARQAQPGGPEHRVEREGPERELLPAPSANLQGGLAPAARGPAHAPIHGAEGEHLGAGLLRYAACGDSLALRRRETEARPMQFDVDRLQPIPAQFGTQVRPSLEAQPLRTRRRQQRRQPARADADEIDIGQLDREGVQRAGEGVEHAARGGGRNPIERQLAALEHDPAAVEAPVRAQPRAGLEEQRMHIGRARVPVELHRPGPRRARPTCIERETGLHALGRTQTVATPEAAAREPAAQGCGCVAHTRGPVIELGIEHADGLELAQARGELGEPGLQQGRGRRRADPVQTGAQAAIRLNGSLDAAAFGQAQHDPRRPGAERRLDVGLEGQSPPAQLQPCRAAPEHAIVEMQATATQRERAPLARTDPQAADRDLPALRMRVEAHAQLLRSKAGTGDLGDLEGEHPKHRCARKRNGGRQHQQQEGAGRHAQAATAAGRLPFGTCSLHATRSPRHPRPGQPKALRPGTHPSTGNGRRGRRRWRRSPRSRPARRCAARHASRHPRRCPRRCPPRARAGGSSPRRQPG